MPNTNHVQGLPGHRQEFPVRQQCFPRQQQDAAPLAAEPPRPPLLGGQREPLDQAARVEPRPAHHRQEGHRRRRCRAACARREDLRSNEPWHPSATRSVSCPRPAPAISTRPTRTRRPRPKRWRSRSTIPSCASTWPTRKRRSSETSARTRSARHVDASPRRRPGSSSFKEPAARRVFCCLPFPNRRSRFRGDVFQRLRLSPSNGLLRCGKRLQAGCRFLAALYRQSITAKAVSYISCEPRVQQKTRLPAGFSSIQSRSWRSGRRAAQPISLQPRREILQGTDAGPLGLMAPLAQGFEHGFSVAVLEHLMQAVAVFHDRLHGRRLADPMTHALACV